MPKNDRPIGIMYENMTSHYKVVNELMYMHATSGPQSCNLLPASVSQWHTHGKSSQCLFIKTNAKKIFKLILFEFLASTVYEQLGSKKRQV